MISLQQTETLLIIVSPKRQPKLWKPSVVIQKVFFYLIYFEIRYLTAIIFDETRITIRATHTKILIQSNNKYCMGGSLPQIFNYLLLLLLPLANAALKVHNNTTTPQKVLIWFRTLKKYHLVTLSLKKKVSWNGFLDHSILEGQIRFRAHIGWDG